MRKKHGDEFTLIFRVVNRANDCLRHRHIALCLRFALLAVSLTRPHVLFGAIALHGNARLGLKLSQRLLLAAEA